ncbi:MAG: hypothetical protein K0R38_5020 [Polyangiaceae bacterium]|jgi:hypothetical protein|nr:hypothetical protein [Polyangiaceae bacterium]
MPRVRIHAAAPSKVGQAPICSRGRGRRTAELADAALRVFTDFEGSMSTRQVFYQLVSVGAVENSQREYERVQRLLVHMRREHEIPYDRIVDRTRGKHQRAGWNGVQDVMVSVAEQYRRNLWVSQDTVVMVACEKQALEGVFSEVVDRYGASLWTLRGYASESFAYEWACEIERLNLEGSDVAIAYFGDHDPSGLGLEQDVQDKHRRHHADFTWERFGLLKSDFDRFGLVNVPVKPSDSRARKYLELHGDRAAELDALRPDELRSRIERAIVAHIDSEEWAALERAEQVERESLRMVTINWNKAVQAAGVNA